MMGFAMQFWGELYKMTFRMRTHIGFCAFVLLEVILFWAFQQENAIRKFKRQLGKVVPEAFFDEYFSALTVAFVVVSVSVFLLGGIYVALVAGDVVSKETEDGTMRLILSRPVSRLRVLVVKYLASLVYTAVLIAFIGGSSYLIGCTMLKADGSLFVMVPEKRIFIPFGFDEGLRRYAMGIGMLAVSMLTVTSIAFMFSCMKMKPAAATIMAVTVLLGDLIMVRIPQLEDYRYLMINTRTDAWVNVFYTPIPWDNVFRDYGILMGINLACFLIGWLCFARRDFKS